MEIEEQKHTTMIERATWVDVVSVTWENLKQRVVRQSVSLYAQKERKTAHKTADIAQIMLEMP